MIYLVVITIIEFLLFLVFVAYEIHFNPKEARYKLKKGFINTVNKFIKTQEDAIYRGITKGRIRGFQKKAILFINDLKENMELPINIPITEFVMILLILVLIMTFLFVVVFFHNLFYVVVLYIPVLVATLCILYTKTTKKRARKNEDILVAENILCNDIGKGFVRDCQENLQSIPIDLKNKFQIFISDIKVKNMEIEESLNLLGMSLGSSSLDFIKKVIINEKYKEDGFEDIFKNIIIVNNMKIAQRNNIEAKIKDMEGDYYISLATVLFFLVLEVIFLPFVKNFYFNTKIGQAVLIGDIIVLIFAYLIVTVVKAREL